MCDILNHLIANIIFLGPFSMWNIIFHQSNADILITNIALEVVWSQG